VPVFVKIKTPIQENVAMVVYGHKG